MQAEASEGREAVDESEHDGVAVLRGLGTGGLAGNKDDTVQTQTAVASFNRPMEVHKM